LNHIVDVIGSNIFNLLGIVGAAAMVTPLSFKLDIITYDLWDLPAITVILIAFMMAGRRVQRAEGAGLLLLYSVYITHHLLPGGLITAITSGP